MITILGGLVIADYFAKHIHWANYSPILTTLSHTFQLRAAQTQNFNLRISSFFSSFSFWKKSGVDTDHWGSPFWPIMHRIAVNEQKCSNFCNFGCTERCWMHDRIKRMVFLHHWWGGQTPLRTSQAMFFRAGACWKPRWLFAFRPLLWDRLLFAWLSPLLLPNDSAQKGHAPKIWVSLIGYIPKRVNEKISKST